MVNTMPSPLLFRKNLLLRLIIVTQQQKRTIIFIAQTLWLTTTCCNCWWPRHCHLRNWQYLCCHSLLHRRLSFPRRLLIQLLCLLLTFGSDKNIVCLAVFVIIGVTFKVFFSSFFFIILLRFLLGWIWALGRGVFIWCLLFFLTICWSDRLPQHLQKRHQKWCQLLQLLILRRLRYPSCCPQHPKETLIWLFQPEE